MSDAPAAAVIDHSTDDGEHARHSVTDDDCSQRRPPAALHGGRIVAEPLQYRPVSRTVNEKRGESEEQDDDQAFRNWEVQTEHSHKPFGGLPAGAVL